MEYALSEHMNFKKLLRSALPCVLMMISISVYSVVDGFFLANFAGTTPFAAVNLMWPFAMILGSLGFMMGTGGSALVAKKFGEGKVEEGNQFFSNCVSFAFFLGLASTLLSVFFLEEIALRLGADEEMLPYCVVYGRILIGGLAVFNLQNLFQSFFTAAEKPITGFLVTLIAGLVNIVLDALLIVAFRLGVVGAGIGTILGQAVGAIIPIVYFSRKNPSLLRLRLARFHWKAIGKMALNGSSEFAGGISASVVSMLINGALMQYFGQNGVAAYGAICYVWMIFAASFIGYNVAVAPRISYALGANNREELRSLYVKSLIILVCFGLFQFLFSELMSTPIAYAFGGGREELITITKHASAIYSFVYLFLGINMFGSAFFTALNDGVTSILLSVARLGVLEVLAVLLLPKAIGGEGIWWSVVLAEGLGTIMNLVVMGAFRYKYHYGKAKEKERISDENIVH